MKPFPSLFLAHGAPDLLLSAHPAKRFLARLGSLMAKPRAIVVVSAHWEAPVTTIGTGAHPETIYDFAGWPDALYEITYPARTDDKLIKEMGLLFGAAGIRYKTNPTRGYDHGVWVPLSLIYPDAQIPLVQLSLTRGKDPRFHLRLGQALAPLRARGVLIIGSGATVHNLSCLAPEGTKPPGWAVQFETWLQTALEARDIDGLLAFAHRSKVALQAHPTDEHLMPLFVSLGAGLHENLITRLHQSFSYSSVGMTCYAFGAIDEINTSE